MLFIKGKMGIYKFIISFNIKDKKMSKFVNFESLDGEIRNIKAQREEDVLLKFLRGIDEIPPFHKIN